jgi:uncharacterized protein (DUF2062 family)
MSDLAIFLTGIGLGLLIVVPVFIAYRHEMDLNIRRRFGASVGEESRSRHERDVRSTSEESSVATSTSAGLSRGVIWFGLSAGVVTIICASLLGNVFALASGVVLITGVLLAIAVGKSKPSS